MCFYSSPDIVKGDSVSKDAYRNFFTKERRQQVSKNFGVTDIETWQMENSMQT